MVVCGHSLEVNVTSSLDFYLSVAQVQLLQQLLRDNMVGMDTPEKSGEVHNWINKCKQTSGLGSQITAVTMPMINILIIFMKHHSLTCIGLQVTTWGCGSTAQDPLWPWNSAPSLHPRLFWANSSHLNIYLLRARKSSNVTLVYYAVFICSFQGRFYCL